MVDKSVKRIAEKLGLTCEALIAELKDHQIEVTDEESVISTEQLEQLIKARAASAESGLKKRKTLTLKKKTLSLTPKSTSSAIKVVKPKQLDMGRRSGIKRQDTTKKPPAKPVQEYTVSSDKTPNVPQPAPTSTPSTHSTSAEHPAQTVRPNHAMPGRSGPIRQLGGKTKPARSRKVTKEVREVEEPKENIQVLHDLAESQLSQKFEKPVAPVFKVVKIPETIVVGDLAKKMSLKVSDLVRELMKMGVMATINQTLDQETAQLLVEEMGHQAECVNEDPYEAMMALPEEENANQAPRAPVVTIMGHVDHGKTTLLDTLRQTRVTAGEAGGITQHMGAYRVKTTQGQWVAFLDTPGHEAFTQMRARGVQSTDIVILVVAADDGVMPQTIEAIQHAKAAQVPMIVAINKMDKPEADPERIKSELAQHEVIPEEWGGETIFVPISAKSGDGLDALVDSILVQAEMLELKARTTGLCRGIVVESSIDKGRGIVATILVQHGQLNKGDILLIGKEYGRVRAMKDDAGRQVTEAGPSTPVEVLGMSGLPNAGDEVFALESEQKAREIATYRQARFRERVLVSSRSSSVSDVFDQLREGELTLLNIVLKADVHGSLEAIVQSVEGLSNDEIRVKVVGKGVGAITETDVNLAVASKAVLLGFNVRADAKARQLVEREGIDVQYYSVIYHLIEQIQAAVEGLKAPIKVETILGVAEVREVYHSSKMGAIAGCMVTRGQVKRKAMIRVLRQDVVIYKGELESLRHYTEAVTEVRQGMECGIGVKDYNDVKVNDQIECFAIEERRASDVERESK